jgi:hypothetical protein
MILAFCLAYSMCFAATDLDAVDWAHIEARGEKHRRALLACRRYAEGWMEFADPVSGLLPRRLRKDFYWNAQDCAADNYPFLVLSSFFTRRDWFTTRMVKILETEQRLCNRKGVLPDDYIFQTRTWPEREPDRDALIFGASEYAKDGLLTLLERFGDTPWYHRLLGLHDAIWKEAYIETEVGMLPSTSHEVAGNLLQVAARLYQRTGMPQYREQAFRLGDYFLLHHHPAHEQKLFLQDHGCEIINGLSEAYFLAAQTDPARHQQWKEPMHALIDAVLRTGRNEDGLLYAVINPAEGTVVASDLTDNWGYDYFAIYTVGLVDQEPRYLEATAEVMAHIERYGDYFWQNNSADGIADSLEGGITLFRHQPDEGAARWIEAMAERLLRCQRDTGIFEGWYGDGNSARTLLMYALYLSQGCWVEPWRADVRVGAVLGPEGTLYVSVAADWPWSGRLCFDTPRHVEILNLPYDYPRLNQWPEWFTLPKEGRFSVVGDVNGEYEAEQLRRDGLPVTIEDKPLHFAVFREQKETTKNSANRPEESTGAANE